MLDSELHSQKNNASDVTQKPGTQAFIETIQAS